jgi:hypothetical protein
VRDSVIPAEAGIHSPGVENGDDAIDSRLRGNDRGKAKIVTAIIATLLLTACAAQQIGGGVADTAPGFWLGVWHGFIFPVAWVVSLFVEEVAIYAVPNNGGWYDFGYFVGIVFLGVGARSAKR